MNFSRVLLKYRTEIIGLMIAIVFISTGLVWPTLIPDQTSGIPGFQDSTWLRNMISVLLIGMGVVSFLWLVIIHRFILRKSKKDYMY